MSDFARLHGRSEVGDAKLQAWLDRPATPFGQILRDAFESELVAIQQRARCGDPETQGPRDARNSNAPEESNEAERRRPAP